MNTLYYGDNLNILRRFIAGESVHLVYLDPPFNSNRNYNVLFRNKSGAEVDLQIATLQTRATTLKNANMGVTDTAVPLSKARISRNDEL